MLFSKQFLGNKGEKQAAKYLKKKGYEIIAQNVRTKCGEIDIIACDRGVYVFVEVKLRSTSIFGMGAEAVTKKKQSHIVNSAQLYCQSNNIEALCRCDVISIDNGEITHIENAF